MKSPWFWIIGIIFAMWIFSSEKSSNTSVHTTYSKPQQPTSPVYSSSTFKGYQCTVDCSGHEAGYEWAEENGIDDPDDCGGNSDSFIEGCQAYAEEQQAVVDEATDDE